MKIPVHNPTKMPIYVGATMIVPGETRHFDEQDVPTHLKPKPAEAEDEPEQAPLSLMAQLRVRGVKDCIEAFPALADDDLAELESLENAEAAPRKTLIAAIAEEKLKRAAADEASKAGGAGDEDGAGNDQGNGG